MEKRKTPRIRFKGFSDDWEQRKLGDIVTRVVRKNENLESKLPLTISAQFGLIAQDEFFDKRIASKNISHYYLIRKGEFAYNKSTSMDAPWGAIKRLEHYDNGVLSTLYIMFRILDENKVNSDYIVSYYVTNLWHKGVREVAAEGARNHGLLNIAPVDFFETTLTIPSNENEQKNIGEYFRRLDRLITLHQRKLEKLKIIKKSMLENCFSKNGEKVPQIRFSGFTNDWEQRKLGSIVVRESDLRVSSNKLPSVEYEDVVAEQGVLNKDIYEKNVEKKGILFTESEILYGKLRPYLHNWLNPNFIGVAVGDWWVLKPKYVEKDFLYALIQLRRFDEITNQSSGSKMPRADWNLVVNSDFDISKLKVEQKKIGTLFSYLDTLITLHQSKLEKLQKIKKALLERMFV